MIWTEEMIAELRRMWSANHTMLQIGKALNVSRCAIAGKISRLGLKRSQSKPLALRQAVQTIPLDQRLGAGPAHLALRGFECKWPINDPQDDDFHFCGAHKNPLSPYCAFHEAMALRKAA